MLAYTQEHFKQVTLFDFREWSIKQRVGSFRIIDQHVQHVAVGPIRYGLPAIVFDGCVLRVYSLEGTSRRLLICKHNVLRVTNSGKESTDGITWNLAGEEEPIDSAVKCKLGGRTRKDQKYDIGIAPDSSHD